MPLKPESVKVNQEETREALARARKVDPEMNLSRLVRALLRAFAAGRVKL